MGGLGQLESLKVMHGKRYHSIIHVWFPVSLPVSILYLSEVGYVKTVLLMEIRQFYACTWRPVGVVTRIRISQDLWCEKTTVHKLPCT